MTYPGLAHDVAALLETLAIPHAHIVGYSLGGGVALHSAIDQPQLVDRLVFAGGARSANSPQEVRLGPTIANDAQRSRKRVSGNLIELAQAIDAQAALGCRLHTTTTSAAGNKGLGGGDRIQAKLVFGRVS